jgi:membrane protein YdbS with pleckstrin-like domain
MSFGSTNSGLARIATASSTSSIAEIDTSESAEAQTPLRKLASIG